MHIKGIDNLGVRLHFSASKDELNLLFYNLRKVHYCPKGVLIEGGRNMVLKDSQDRCVAILTTYDEKDFSEINDEKSRDFLVFLYGGIERSYKCLAELEKENMREGGFSLGLDFFEGRIDRGELMDKLDRGRRKKEKVIGEDR